MDHERVNVHTTSMSCGVLELSRINEDTEGVLYALGSRLYHPSRGDPVALFIFSDIAFEKTSSSRLMDEVQKRLFGVVETSFPCENPKTGNVIVVFTWTINHEQFKKWYAEQRVKKLSKVGR
jgi:hypothetical protein